MTPFIRSLVAADLIGLIENIANPSSAAEMQRRKELQERTADHFEEAFWDRQNGHGEDE